MNIDELLDRWEEAREKGRSLSAEELCGDCPELLDELREKIAALESLAGFLEGGGSLIHDLSDAGRYHPTELHARGGLGEVYRARDEELGREVALKRTRRSDLEDRFVREAEITGRLEHPGIVPVYGLGKDARGRPFYAMRFVRGETLDEAIARDEAPRTLLRRFLTVCEAVAYAHDRGVIHRDLKPQNILLGAFGETVLVDWGLAKPVGESEEGRAEEVGELHDVEATQVGARKGSPAYMSPEQTRGEEVGPGTDLFALGATLRKILTGEARGDLKAAPKPLAAVCRKAMADEAADRYADALDLGKDVERWLNDEPVSTWREPLLRRMRRWAKRHRVLVTSAAVALVIAAAGLAVLAEQERRAGERLARKNVELEGALYRNAVQLAANEIAAGRPSIAAEALASTERRGFEWYHLKRRLGGEEVRVELGSSRFARMLAFDDGKLYVAPGVPVYPKRPAESLHGFSNVLCANGTYALVRRAGGSEVDVVYVPMGEVQRELGDHGKSLGFSISPKSTRYAYVTRDGLNVKETIPGGQGGVIVRFGVEALAAWTAFSPDGRYVAVVFTTRFPDSKDDEGVALALTIYDFHLFRQPFKASLVERVKFRYAAAQMFSVSALAFSPDGKRLAVPTNTPGVSIRDVKTGAPVAYLPTGAAITRSVAFFPDGRILTGSGRIARIWSAEGKLDRELLAHERDIHAVAVAPDGARFVTACPGEVKVWDTNTDQGVRRVEADATHLARLPDGRLAVRSDFEVSVWDPVTRTPIPDVLPPSNFKFEKQESQTDLESETATYRGAHPDGTRIAVATIDPEQREWVRVTIRDAKTMDRLLDIPLQGVRTVRSVAFGDVLVVLDGDGNLHFLDGRPTDDH